eukprot:TRINITY_DN3267_c0_g3_i1.p1 TRINITY_DN3267_c0_g3~~TRINITY_DN3267_c0_g3_i1.p1  ORF type:complete len:237 (+),score=104.08 TRINITY_DN3267_c0_g3_i1:201-911(+)
MSQLIQIKVVSDVVCPWCLVGKKRLEKAMSLYNGKAEFKVTWKPFFLDSELPREAKNKIEHYNNKFGREKVPLLLDRMKKVGKDEGIEFSFGGEIANTITSHRLIHYAGLKGDQNKVVDELFADYFEREKNIGSIKVLTEAAERAGLNGQEVKEYLEGKQDEKEVFEEAKNTARNYRISGVPFFIIENKYAISGAEDPQTFKNIFDKILKENEGKETVAPKANEAESCAKDGSGVC